MWERKCKGKRCEMSVGLLGGAEKGTVGRAVYNSAMRNIVQGETRSLIVPGCASYRAPQWSCPGKKGGGRGSIDESEETRWVKMQSEEAIARSCMV